MEHAFHDDETRKTMDMEDELSAMFDDFEQTIKEKDDALKKKDDQLLTAISLLRSLGLDDKSIAEKLNIDVKDL